MIKDIGLALFAFGTTSMAQVSPELIDKLGFGGLAVGLVAYLVRQNIKLVETIIPIVQDSNALMARAVVTLEKLDKRLEEDHH